MISSHHTRKDASAERCFFSLQFGAMSDHGKDEEPRDSKGEDFDAYDLFFDDLGDVSEKFKQILQELFKRFDVDEDGVLSESELKEFSKACGSDPFSEEEITEIKENFDWSDQGEGGMLPTGFEMMYAMQSGSRPEETWKDMKTLGVAENLQ